MFHVSRKFHGFTWTPTPRVPHRTMTNEDQSTPRVCVSPTVSQCLLAIDGINSLEHSAIINQHSHWYIYQTDHPPVKVKPHQVPDVELTNEHWITETAQFKLIGEVGYSITQNEIYVLWSDYRREVILQNVLRDFHQDFETPFYQRNHTLHQAVKNLCPEIEMDPWWKPAGSTGEYIEFTVDFSDQFTQSKEIIQCSP